MNKMIYMNETLYTYTDEARLIAAGAPCMVLCRPPGTPRSGYTHTLPERTAGAPESLSSLTQTGWKGLSAGTAFVSSGSAKGAAVPSHVRYIYANLQRALRHSEHTF